MNGTRFRAIEKETDDWGKFLELCDNFLLYFIEEVKGKADENGKVMWFREC